MKPRLLEFIKGARKVALDEHLAIVKRNISEIRGLHDQIITALENGPEKFDLTLVQSLAGFNTKVDFDLGALVTGYMIVSEMERLETEEGLKNEH